MIDQDAKEILEAAAQRIGRGLDGIPDPIASLRAAVAAVAAGDCLSFAVEMAVARTAILALREEWQAISTCKMALEVMGERVTEAEVAAATAQSEVRSGEIMIRGKTDEQARDLLAAHDRECRDKECIISDRIRAALRAREAAMAASP